MFCSQVMSLRGCALSASLSLVVLCTVALPASAQEGYAKSSTRIFNMADDTSAERDTMSDEGQSQQNSKTNTRTDVKVMVGKPDATLGGDASLADGVEGNEPTAPPADDASVQVDVEVKTSPAVQKEAPAKTARERIYDRIRKNRSSD